MEVDMNEGSNKILDKCNEAMGELIPSKSKKRYEIEYKNLCLWRMVNEVEKVSEDIVLAYMLDLSKKLVSSSLW
ncbi:hypothetical protein C0J52_09191 [Blattella germanica]|nr:hypothetical protein C0J52_09191 [Blattella germanica]